MLAWIAVIFLLINVSFAEVGKISKVLGSGDAYLLRNQEKHTLTGEFDLEEGDEIFAQDNVIQIHLYPSTQISLAKQTQIKISQNLIEESQDTEKAFSVIDFIKGLVRIQVTKDSDQEIEQKVVADGVAFAVRGTEFEISDEGDDFDLDVIEGEVEVSSPHVQTFVPEVVKANEGFRFNKKARKFQRRKFGMKFKNHPGFKSKAEMRAQWKQKRAERRLKMNHKKGQRSERLERNQKGRAQRRERKNR